MKPKYDEKKAQELVGKDIIIGLTYLDNNDNIIERKQLYGDIIRITESGVFIIIRNTGEEFSLPPQLEAFEKAPEGEYRFKTTGEVIINPALMTTWTVRQSKEE